MTKHTNITRAAIKKAAVKGPNYGLAATLLANPTPEAKAEAERLVQKQVGATPYLAAALGFTKAKAAPKPRKASPAKAKAPARRTKSQPATLMARHEQRLVSEVNEVAKERAGDRKARAARKLAQNGRASMSEQELNDVGNLVWEDVFNTLRDEHAMPGGTARRFASNGKRLFLEGDTPKEAVSKAVAKGVDFLLQDALAMA